MRDEIMPAKSTKVLLIALMVKVASSYNFPVNSNFNYNDLNKAPVLDYRQLPGYFDSICFINNQWIKCPREWLLQNINSGWTDSVRDRRLWPAYANDHYYHYHGDGPYWFNYDHYYPYHTIAHTGVQGYIHQETNPSASVGNSPTLVRKYTEYPAFSYQEYQVTEKPMTRYSYVSLVTEAPKRMYNRISHVTEASKPIVPQYIFVGNVPEPNKLRYNFVNHETQVPKPQYYSYRTRPAARQPSQFNYKNNVETPLNYNQQIRIPITNIVPVTVDPQGMGERSYNNTISPLAGTTSKAESVSDAGKADVKPAQHVEAKTTAIDTKETHQQVTEVVKEMASPPNVTDAHSMRSVSERDQFYKFQQSIDRFERRFYEATFTKLSAISPADRRENGISFVQSGLFMYLLLVAFEMEEDPETKVEIAKCLDFPMSNQEKLNFMKRVISTLPVANEGFKFRWSTRLVLGSANVTQEFLTGPASVLQLRITQLNGTETPETLSKSLNQMVEEDSGGAMRETFEEEELSQGVKAALISTMYVRGRWRASPTLLNGTRPFRDAEDAPQRSTRMIRINDVMKYADLSEFDAEAIEISYSTQGLSLLLLIPRGRSLRKLAERVAVTEIANITSRMSSMRVAATVPLYTLRMTLLLPSKLQAMGITRLVDATTDSGGSLRLSHAVQRLMFWAEAGRNAFKDDGIEWDEPAELELMVDRPYLFYVRWHNMTLMNGNFVL